MGCTGCSVAVENGKPKGCGSKGNCSTGGCNRMNTFDWLSQMEVIDVDNFEVVEVSFKNGSRKGFYHCPAYLQLITGDNVVVDVGHGYDIGCISLSGELVRLQMKRKKVNQDKVVHSIIRKANARDMDRLQEARSKERQTLIRARAIARTLKLDMKMGDVEYQGDNRKATFFYTANGRVDFRELIRHYAQEFKVKIEMRQIGARQESARIGGLGSCGRELCCSTWLTDFKSVSTAAARYQNLAINQAKLSGQCGRLKCCLNYELDAYMEAVKAFPNKADKLQTEAGKAVLVKTDIFKQLMFYTYVEGKNRGKLYALSIEQVQEVQEMNKKGRKPLELSALAKSLEPMLEEQHDYEDVTGVIELPPEERRKKKRQKSRSRSRNKTNEGQNPKRKEEDKPRSKRRRPARKKATDNKAESQAKKPATNNAADTKGKANTNAKANSNANKSKPTTDKPARPNKKRQRPKAKAKPQQQPKNQQTNAKTDAKPKQQQSTKTEANKEQPTAKKGRNNRRNNNRRRNNKRNNNNNQPTNKNKGGNDKPEA